LEEEHNHKKLLEAVQGHAAPDAPDGLFSEMADTPKIAI
jgi:hypothetical protein